MPRFTAVSRRCCVPWGEQSFEINDGIAAVTWRCVPRARARARAPLNLTSLCECVDALLRCRGSACRSNGFCGLKSCAARARTNVNVVDIVATRAYQGGRSFGVLVAGTIVCCVRCDSARAAGRGAARYALCVRRPYMPCYVHSC